MREIKIIYENGNYINTQINGSDEDILKYYLGRYFNFGDIENRDNMQKVIGVYFCDTGKGKVLGIDEIKKDGKQ
jgi:hypothetical protein